MNKEDIFIKLLEKTGEWGKLDFIKIIDGEMIGTAKHKFDLVCYTHGRGETFLKVIIEEQDKDEKK